MSRIRLLSDQIINRIAAGEVVQRPAAALKELIENSLDAGSDKIEIEAEAGGRRLIKVSDNGRGMEPDDLLLAVERHATSKLSDESDLLKIETLGFRGEALPSIGAVSRMTILSAAGEDGAGRLIRISGGKIISVEDAARDRGTTVIVQDLFFNVPARRKFLKSQSTEASHILENAQSFALGHPSLRLIYRHNGQEVLSTSPRENAHTRLARILGRKNAGAMFPFEGREGPIEVSGFLGSPDLDRARATGLHLYVNGRPVMDRLLTRAVIEAYKQRLAGGRYPVAVVFVKLDPELVDVNVHPAKAEVLFRRSNEVFSAVSNVIARALSQKLRSVPPVEPRPGPSFSAPAEPARVSESLPWEDPPEQPPVYDYRPSPPAPQPARENRWDDIVRPDKRPITQPRPENHDRPDESFEPVRGYSRGLRPVGQIFRSYILAQGGQGLYVVDQHAAHERILFEKMEAELARGALPSQGLLIPETLELSPVKSDLLEKLVDRLAAYGFDLAPFGGRTFVLRAVPAVLTGKDAVKTVEEILDQAEGYNIEKGLADFEKELLSSLACHSAIKAGDEMTIMEMERLLSDLEKTKIPTNCPHGRPLLFFMDRREIEKKFKRL